MVYADYAYYTKIYLGNAIAEPDFPRLALRASERVDTLTWGRASAYYEHMPEPVSQAACAIAEIMLQSERGNALLSKDGIEPRVQTEITGKEHITYFATPDTMSEAGQAAIERGIQQAARQYLALTGLMYAGVE